MPLPGGKNTPKMPLLGLKCQKVDSAPQNGPTMIYDGLFEAYGQVV